MNSLPPIDPAGRSDRERSWFRFLACIYAGIVGLRVWLIEQFGASIAAGDDLDGIARRILLPWRNGTLTLSALLRAHNGDHRIVATRLWEIFWYVLNGSWDPKLVMIAKTSIYAAAAALFIQIFAGRLERHRFAAGAVLGALFAFPFGYQNMLWAFQSQFDFFLLAAAVGWLALISDRPALALTAAALAIFALGSGPIIAASFLPFVAWTQLEGRRRRNQSSTTEAGPVLSGRSSRKAAWFAASACVIVIGGLLSPTREAPPHLGTGLEKAGTLAKLYAWPFSNLLSAVVRLPESAGLIPGPLLRFPSAEHSWMLGLAGWLHVHPSAVLLLNCGVGLLLLAPLAVLAWRVAGHRISSRAAVGPLALGGFAFLMLVATAIARADQVTVAMRYLDHVVLAAFASIAAAFVLAGRSARARPWLAAWALMLGAGYLVTMGATLSQMRHRAPQARLAILQRYFATTPHDHSAMTQNDAYQQFIVGHDPTQFMSELDEPGVAEVMPLAVTAPDRPLGPAAAVASLVGKSGLVIVLVALLSGAWISFRARRPEPAVADEAAEPAIRTASA